MKKMPSISEKIIEIGTYIISQDVDRKEKKIAERLLIHLYLTEIVCSHVPHTVARVKLKIIKIYLF